MKMPWTIHRETGDQVAATAYATDADGLANVMPRGSTVRNAGRICWTVGTDVAEDPSEVMLERHYRSGPATLRHRVRFDEELFSKCLALGSENFRKGIRPAVSNARTGAKVDPLRTCLIKERLDTIRRVTSTKNQNTEKTMSMNFPGSERLREFRPADGDSCCDPLEAVPSTLQTGKATEDQRMENLRNVNGFTPENDAQI